jgi:hypothetical protein
MISAPRVGVGLVFGAILLDNGMDHFFINVSISTELLNSLALSLSAPRKS